MRTGAERPPRLTVESPPKRTSAQSRAGVLRLLMAARVDQIDRRQEALDLRNSGLEPVGPMAWGTHFCQFYQGQQDLLDIVLPYLRAGVDAGEFCMWVTWDPYAPESALAALRTAYPDADKLIEAGQIEIVASQ